MQNSYLANFCGIIFYKKLVLLPQVIFFMIVFDYSIFNLYKQ